jgi:uncharacterized membrane protein
LLTDPGGGTQPRFSPLLPILDAWYLHLLPAGGLQGVYIATMLVCKLMSLLPLDILSFTNAALLYWGGAVLLLPEVSDYISAGV